MFADLNDATLINYHPCRYGASKIAFRGPMRRIKGEYIAYIGSSETYGRFTKDPYPSLVETLLDIPAINLGCHQGGIDAFSTAPGLIDICSMAQVTVIQIMGGANMSNRFYAIDPRHNNRFVRASKLFKEVFPDVNFADITTVNDLLNTLVRVGPDRIHLVRQELQSAWVARMRSLLHQIDGKKVLLWMSDHEPFSATNKGTICRSPLFVERTMQNAVKDFVDATVEVVATPSEIALGRSKLIFAREDFLEAQDMLGPVVHQRVAEMLAPLLATMIHDLPMSSQPAVVSKAS